MIFIVWGLYFLLCFFFNLAIFSYFIMLYLVVAFFVFTCLGFVSQFESMALCNLLVCQYLDYFLFKYCSCYPQIFALGLIYLSGSFPCFLNFLSCCSGVWIFSSGLYSCLWVISSVVPNLLLNPCVKFLILVLEFSFDICKNRINILV